MIKPGMIVALKSDQTKQAAVLEVYQDESFPYLDWARLTKPLRFTGGLYDHITTDYRLNDLVVVVDGVEFGNNYTDTLLETYDHRTGYYYRVYEIAEQWVEDTWWRFACQIYDYDFYPVGVASGTSVLNAYLRAKKKVRYGKIRSVNHGEYL